MSNESVDQLIAQLESLKLQETTILRKLVAARAQENSNRISEERAEVFSIGDTVLITNRVRTTSGHAPSSNDKTGIVTKITDKRVFFRTLSGTDTWRARHNLRHTNP
jgi:hypothetical protein